MLIILDRKTSILVFEDALSKLILGQVKLHIWQMVCFMILNAFCSSFVTHFWCMPWCTIHSFTKTSSTYLKCKSSMLHTFSVFRIDEGKSSYKQFCSSFSATKGQFCNNPLFTITINKPFIWNGFRNFGRLSTRSTHLISFLVNFSLHPFDP